MLAVSCLGHLRNNQRFHVPLRKLYIEPWLTPQPKSFRSQCYFISYTFPSYQPLFFAIILEQFPLPPILSFIPARNILPWIITLFWKKCLRNFYKSNIWPSNIKSPIFSKTLTAPYFKISQHKLQVRDPIWASEGLLYIFCIVLMFYLCLYLYYLPWVI